MDPESGCGENGKELENGRVGVVHSLGKLLDPFPSGMRNSGSFWEVFGKFSGSTGQEMGGDDGKPVAPLEEREFAVGMEAAGIFPNPGRISFGLEIFGILEIVGRGPNPSQVRTQQGFP